MTPPKTLKSGLRPLVLGGVTRPSPRPLSRSAEKAGAVEEASLTEAGEAGAPARMVEAGEA